VSPREPQGRVWLDGTFVPAGSASVPVSDLGLQWGFGVFETLAVRGGNPLELEEHLARLTSGAERLEVPLPAIAVLKEACETLAGEAATSFGWLKVLATRSGRRAVFGGGMDAGEEGRETTAILVPWTRSQGDPLAPFKTLSCAHAALAAADARRRGAEDGIWRNARGHLAEASGSNLFVVHRGKVFTPGPGDGILLGITRGQALRAARKLGLIVHEGKVRLERLEKAQEVFLTSSVRGVRAVVALDGGAVGKGLRGPITEAISAEVAKMRSWRSSSARGVPAGQREGA
jgi:branched-subunit amino acid aminotransferase/4-amino-4-deoxychorismate lyase